MHFHTLNHCIVDFWKTVEKTSAEGKKSPELASTVMNKKKMEQKQEKWDLSVNDDSWYRAPQFHPEVTETV